MKKNDDTEMKKVNEEEMADVSGGSIAETAYDSEILKSKGLIDEAHGSFYTAFHFDSVSREVKEGWAKAGITSIQNPVAKNEYYEGYKILDRHEARKKL